MEHRNTFRESGPNSCICFRNQTRDPLHWAMDADNQVYLRCHTLAPQQKPCGWLLQNNSMPNNSSRIWPELCLSEQIIPHEFCNTLFNDFSMWLTCRVVGTGSVWRRAATARRCCWSLASTAACSVARHSRNHRPGTHGVPAPANLHT